MEKTKESERGSTYVPWRSQQSLSGSRAFREKPRWREAALRNLEGKHPKQKEKDVQRSSGGTCVVRQVKSKEACLAEAKWAEKRGVKISGGPEHLGPDGLQKERWIS